jgi:hypothetical protein
MAPAARPRPLVEQDPEEAETTLRQMNDARARLSGINKLPIPQGHVSSTPRGITVRTDDGRLYSLRADGTLSHFQSGVPNAPNRPAFGSVPAGAAVRAEPAFALGTRATFRPDGKIISLHTGGPNGINIQHGARGWRVITAHRPDHSTLVSTGRHSGYLERTIDQDGRTLVERTYLSGSRTWTRSYEGSFQTLPNSAMARAASGMAASRIVIKHYIPRYTYQPVFYGWVYGGWASPVSYRWNWGSRRWFIYYSLYFYPWPSYPDGSYWLTDYVLGQTLANGFDTQQSGDGSAAADAGSGANVDSAPVDAGPPSDDETVYAPATTAITPEVKQEIAAEVHQQLAQAGGADTGTDTVAAPDAAPYDPAQFMQVGHIFVVSTPIAANARGQGLPIVRQECSLSPGDLLQLTRIIGGPGESASQTGTSVIGGSLSTGELEVVSSQRGDCPVGVELTLPSLALQEMENDFQGQLVDGLHVLYSQQGKDGLPSSPPTTVIEQPAAADAAPGAAELSAQLQSLQTEANQAEAHLAQTVMSVQAATNQP